MNDMKKIIDLEPLNDQFIKENKISLKDLWMIKDADDNVHGPYDTDTLRGYICENSHLFMDTQAYNLHREEWLWNIIQACKLHSFFRREKTASGSFANGQ